jgi:hypothetical protein
LNPKYDLFKEIRNHYGRYRIKLKFHLNSPFLLATYGIWGKYWFTVEKNEKNLFIKTCFERKKKFPSVTRRCRCRCKTKFVSILQFPPYKFESWIFGSQSLLGQLDALHTQNFEIQVPKGSHLREVFEVLLFRP